MKLGERVYSALLVSLPDGVAAAVGQLLPSRDYEIVVYAKSVSEGRRLFAEREFDFVIVNNPSDGTGVRFAMDCCQNPGSVVLLLCDGDSVDEINDRVCSFGVFTLQKPVSRAAMEQALSWMASARERIRRAQQKAASIEERMEEIRVINRAKFLLISELKMTEPEAHHYIEKKAMDNCIPKRAAAESIIRLYS